MTTSVWPGMKAKKTINFKIFTRYQAGNVSIAVIICECIQSIHNLIILLFLLDIFTVLHFVC